jgi:hypothetical protein
MAKKTKNQTPPKGNTSTKRKSPLSIVTPTKQVKKKGKSAEFKRVKTVLSLLSSVFLLSLLSALLLASPSLLMLLLLTLLLLSVRMVLDSVDVVLVLAAVCDKGAVLFDSVYPKKKKLNDAPSPPRLLSQVSMSPSTEKKLAFDLTSKNKLQHYEIDWFNPLVILSESIEYLKKNEILPNTHGSQLSFLMNKIKSGEIKLSFSNTIGKIGHTATKLCYPLPVQKDKIILRFIQLVLSVMIYSVRETVM